MSVRSNYCGGLGLLAWIFSAVANASDPAVPAPSQQATDSPSESGAIVVYTALDRQFSEPIFALFTERTGVRVAAVYDTESTKTVGLANRIRAEAARPRCDVFWNNEIVHTLRLHRAGLLAPHNSAEAQHYAARFRDPEGHWYGFAARARVLIVNRERVTRADYPTSIRDLAQPRWRGQVGIAKPLFGTTASHVACLFEKLGPGPAEELLRAMKANDIQILGGNKPAADMVAAGRLAFALTDTDDYFVVKQSGAPVELVLPDNSPEAGGVLLLPNTLARIKNSPNPQAAGRLIDFLLSAEIEARLVTGPSAQIPLHAKSPVRSPLWPADAHAMTIDFARAAERFTEAAQFIEREFLR